MHVLDWKKCTIQVNTLVRFSVGRAHSGSRRSLWDVQSVADEAGAGVVWEQSPADAAQRHTASGPRPAAQLRVPARHEELSRPSPGSLALWWGTWHLASSVRSYSQRVGQHLQRVWKAVVVSALCRAGNLKPNLPESASVYSFTYERRALLSLNTCMHSPQQHQDYCDKLSEKIHPESA